MVKIYGYARVSSKEQNLDRQMIALREYVQDERDIITDKESGKNFDRPGYRSLRDALLRHGDTLVIKSLDRLGRNKEQVKAELEYFKAQGIRLKIIDLPTTMTELPEGQSWIIDMINNILIEVLSSIAEQERETIRQRQAEGIAAAKKKGKHLMAYSGYTFEELLGLPDPSVKKLLSQLDLLVDGRFIEAERNIELRFRGSENQRVLDVPRSLAEQAPVWAEQYR